MRDEVIKKLNELQDVKYREFHSGLCPGLENIIGVRTPAMRKLAKEIAKGDYRRFLEEVQDEYYEETLLEGLVIALAKIDWDEREGYLRKFVPKINNWATCDLVCSSFRLKGNEVEKMWELLLEYAKSEKEYERRFAIVMAMDHYLTPEYLSTIFRIVNGIKTEQYYVNMAVAWLISVAFVKYREETLEFLKDNNLNAFTQNKAIQKIRESYRISNEDKEMVKKLKR